MIELGRQLEAGPPQAKVAGIVIVGIGIIATVAVNDFPSKIKEGVESWAASGQAPSDPRAYLPAGVDMPIMAENKAAPNPNGSKGAPDHQQTADEEAAKMGPNGQREVRVQTPGGQKGSRVIDAAKVENGKVTGATQVIRPNKNGTPPAREVRAANDIQKATGVKPNMVPVRPIKKPDGQ